MIETIIHTAWRILPVALIAFGWAVTSSSRASIQLREMGKEALILAFFVSSYQMVFSQNEAAVEFSLFLGERQ